MLHILGDFMNKVENLKKKNSVLSAVLNFKAKSSMFLFLFFVPQKLFVIITFSKHIVEQMVSLIG